MTPGLLGGSGDVPGHGALVTVLLTIESPGDLAGDGLSIRVLECFL